MARLRPRVPQDPVRAGRGLFVLVILIPFLLTIYISLLKWRANRPFETARFAGLENYEDVLTSELFWLSLGRTFYFAGAAVAIELVVGFVLAMLVSQCTRSKKLYTTIFLVPMMIVPIVVGYNFSMIYIDSGPLNQILAPLLEPLRHRSAHPLAVASGRRAMGDHPGRHLAVDLAHLPDLPVGLLGAAAAAHQRRARHGRDARGRSSGASSSRCSSRRS